MGERPPSSSCLMARRAGSDPDMSTPSKGSRRHPQCCCPSGQSSPTPARGTSPLPCWPSVCWVILIPTRRTQRRPAGASQGRAGVGRENGLSGPLGGTVHAYSHPGGGQAPR